MAGSARTAAVAAIPLDFHSLLLTAPLQSRALAQETWIKSLLLLCLHRLLCRSWFLESCFGKTWVKLSAPLYLKLLKNAVQFMEWIENIILEKWQTFNNVYDISFGILCIQKPQGFCPQHRFPERRYYSHFTTLICKCCFTWEGHSPWQLKPWAPG